MATITVGDSAEWKDAVEKVKPKNKIKFHDRNKGQKTLNDKLLNDLKEKVDKNVQSIHKRNAWLEATKRKNYIHEYDRLSGIIDPILNKDRNAIGIDALKQRREDLIKMAHASVNWQNEDKHEIYKKADEIQRKKKRAQKARDMGLYYCEACDKMMTAGQHANPGLFRTTSSMSQHDDGTIQYDSAAHDTAEHFR